MIQKIVVALIHKQTEKHIIAAEDKQIYRYGYVLLFEVILNMAIALIIGILFSQMKTILFFLGVYIPLRSFCGGWHADKIWKCTIISNIMLLLLVYGVEHIAQSVSYGTMLPVCFLNMVCVALFAPIETESKKLSEDERKNYRRKIKIILAVHLIIVIVSKAFYVKGFVFIVMFAHIMQNIMLLLGIAKQRSCCKRECGD